MLLAKSEKMPTNIELIKGEELKLPCKDMLKIVEILWVKLPFELFIEMMLYHNYSTIFTFPLVQIIALPSSVIISFML